MRTRRSLRSKHVPFFAAIENLEPRQLLAAHIAGNPAIYATIQAAVDAASAGATINVDAGTYPELVTVNKTLTLRGAKAGVDARTRSTAGESVVRGQTLSTGRSSGFYIHANNVVLDGFTVQDDSSSNLYGAGVVLAPGIGGAHVVNNIIQHNIAGLYLANASGQALIQHNVFASNNNDGANVGRGIYTDGGVSGGNLTNVVIDSNTFTSNSGPDKIESAIGLESQTQGKQSHITITNNTFTNNGKAVLLMNVTDVVISGNTISGSTDLGSAALRVEGGVSHVQIVGNTLKNNKNAAIRIDQNASSGANSDIKINNNNFIGNAQGGLKVDAGTYNGTLDATHNYWGSPSGPSGDAAGSGDSLLANGNAVVFAPWSTTLVTPTSPPTNSPPPPPPPPTSPPPPPPVHHKKKKPAHLTKAQKARLAAAQAAAAAAAAAKKHKHKKHQKKHHA